MKRDKVRTEPRFIRYFPIQVSRGEILRLLGAGEQKTQLRKDTEKIIREAERLSRELIKPRGVYRILESADLEKLGPLQGKELAGLGLCTIGAELEARVKELMATGHEPEGYVLDAVGSVAAEATADAINAKICHWAAAQGLVATPRFSPGYGDWSLEEQRVIFRLLPAGQIGMSLNPSCMMIPRKSVSFAVSFAKEASAGRPKNPCQQCGLENCPFRRK
jgi:hypothetical protein